jgi:DNA-binding NarL/FixJ family response regulator
MSKKPFRVVVADDHPVVREGLTSVINQHPALIVCAEAYSTTTTLACVEQERPDALLLDLLLDSADGVTLIRELLARQPNLKILVISLQAEQLCARPCLEAGAAAYISKIRPTREIVDALCKTLDLPPDETERPPELPVKEYSFPRHLTRSESEAARLVLEGLDNQQIADRLGISIVAVKVRLHGVYRKCNVQSRTQLVAFLRVR